MNKNNAITLLNQIIEQAEKDDKEHKLMMFQKHSCQKADGTSWMVFHLKELKKTIEE